MDVTHGHCPHSRVSVVNFLKNTGWLLVSDGCMTLSLFFLEKYNLILTLKIMKSEPRATAHPFNASTQEARRVEV